MSEQDNPSTVKLPANEVDNTPTEYHDPGESVLKALGQTIGHDPRVSLRSSGELEGPLVRTSSNELDGITFRDGSRYRLDGEIARGGMGAVLKGRDTDLGRDLAIKILLDRHRDRPDVIHRFVEEAQIGGQLQHPGIVPVHELGQFEDGRPFFTMKLVKGKTLEALLSERESPDDDRARFVGIFEQVCQTMAYAHSRGVIHRDLKPANIMVGAFGEVQVMDWGLAKVLAEGGVADEKRAEEEAPDVSVIQTIRSQGSDIPESESSHGTGSQTMVGSVLGTPAYMPPEQATGNVDRLDERTDVFALGAILCRIFTGKPPYTGKDRKEVFKKSMQAKLDDCYQRLDESDLDPELRKLAMDCLQTEPNNRPRDAGVVASRVEAYVKSAEQRLRQAQLEKVKADTQVAEERKRRFVLMGLAASVLATLIVAGGGWLWLKQKDAALAKADADAQIKAMAQRSRLAQQVGQELSTARALGVSETEDLPDPVALRRAVEAIERASKLVMGADVDEQLVSEVNALHDQLAAIKRDHDFSVDLEKAWEREMQYRGQRNATGALGNVGAEKPPKDDAESRERDALHPRRAYESAFTKWGMDINDVAAADATKKLNSISPKLRNFAFASLDRWHALLNEPTQYWQWRLRSWTTLNPVKFKSRSGAKLEVLEDQSLLTSGEQAYGGYDLEFETDCKELSALQLEAMLHESLPSNGPGRAIYGEFGMSGLTVHWASRSDLSKKRRLLFDEAVADFSWPSDEITTESWNVTGGGGRAHSAIFHVAEPPQSPTGFHLWITHQDRPRGEWEDQNIGRLRWSVTSDMNNERANQVQARTLQAVVESADPNSWRNALRKELYDWDVLALVRRANDEHGCADQPNDILVQLANSLRRTRGKQLYDAFSNTVNWQVAEPFDLKSEHGVELTKQDDNSVIASGALPNVDTISLTTPAPKKQITAVRLEVIPELLNNGYAEKSLGRNGDLVLRECSVMVNSRDAEDTVTKQQVPVDYGFTNDPTWWVSVAELFDGNEDTFRTIAQRSQPRSIVLVLRPHRAAHDMEFKIVSGYAAQHTISRFRISFTTDTIPEANVHKTALNLLERMCQRDPTNFWVRLELSRSYRKQTPPQFDDAIRHASAAIALQPNQSAGPEAMLRATRLSLARHDNRLGRLMREHHRQLRDLDANHELVNGYIELAYRTATERARQFDYEGAQSMITLAKQMNEGTPQENIGLGWLNDFSWKILLEHDSAVVAPISVDLARRAIEREPFYNGVNTLGVALCLAGDWEESIEVLNQAMSMLDGGGHQDWLFLAMSHWKLGNHEKAREWFQKAIEEIDAARAEANPEAGDGENPEVQLSRDEEFYERIRKELQGLMDSESNAQIGPSGE